jgi:hypothetical protein
VPRSHRGCSTPLTASISFVPPASGSYEVATAAISRLIGPTATPPFGDMLTPAAAPPFTLTVTPVPPLAGTFPRHLRIEGIRAKKGTVIVTGKFDSPSPVRATVSLLVERLGSLMSRKKHHKKHGGDRAGASKAKRPRFKNVETATVASGATEVTLPRGFHYAVRLAYTVPGHGTVSSATKHVAVP